MLNNEEFVLIGKVLGTHGIRGQLRVMPYSGDSGSISGLKQFYLATTSGPGEPYVIARSAPYKKQVLVTLRGYDDINAVQVFVGREVYIRRDQLPRLPDGEYYWIDLIGLKVLTTGGESLGTLKDILQTGENDVYVVQSAAREYLIPAIEEVVVEIDLAGRRMIIAPLEGLLDL